MAGKVVPASGLAASSPPGVDLFGPGVRGMALYLSSWHSLLSLTVSIAAAGFVSPPKIQCQVLRSTAPPSHSPLTRASALTTAVAYAFSHVLPFGPRRYGS